MSADKMPPLPEIFWTVAVYWRDAMSFDEINEARAADELERQMHAYARTYAAEQVRELVEALEHINRWCCYATEEDINARLLALQQIGQTARIAIAKHKEQP